MFLNYKHVHDMASMVIHGQEKGFWKICEDHQYKHNFPF